MHDYFLRHLEQSSSSSPARFPSTCSWQRQRHPHHRQTPLLHWQLACQKLSKSVLTGQLERSPGWSCQWFLQRTTEVEVHSITTCSSADTLATEVGKSENATLGNFILVKSLDLFTCSMWMLDWMLKQILWKIASAASRRWCVECGTQYSGTLAHWQSKPGMHWKHLHTNSHSNTKQ